MTRSEAIDLWIDEDACCQGLVDTPKLINKIFDDFENQNKKLEEFTFTSCDDCKHKIDGYFQKECISCKRYYACHFEKKQ